MQTDRLNIKPWCPNDVEAFIALHQNPEVMQYLLEMDRNQCLNFFNKIKTHFNEYGFGFWALKEKQSNQLVGLAGLAVPKFNAQFTPCVEIGWRLVREFWGKGYATEAAGKILEYAFLELRLEEVVAFTVPNNLRSRAVMSRLGMSSSTDDDFMHPLLAQEHPLAQHVLYKLSKEKWLQRKEWELL